ncbi:MAG: sugar ABC transporter ATP-binding protein [Thermobacillus sp. ZCTH02-B1]|uniref:carbohydrate ABC transporter permease n=1 Tax=Thermobacillus sp. ZCTH02-B1 TaxID=1858795 RepID=UPI000B566754|nr:carbohydrate ABC transporter permease [Thermobacillus sp. ZCTH02-B1]OUM97546.1 MAG: sugar ABC transporter ATP-binding protein [Thermobacillus sp. ZCTH02-B1]
MAVKRKPRIHLILLYLVLVFGSAVYLLPLVWMIRSALMDASQIFIVPPVWIPDPIRFGNFSKALGTLPFDRYFVNTMIIVIGNVTGAVLTSAICGYSFARLRWPGRDFFFALLMSGMMLPYAVTLIPTFLGWRTVVGPNTYLPLIVPAWFGGGAFNIFLVRQFMRTIPKSMDEAALVDGAGYFQIFRYVIFPLSRSVVIVVALFQFMAVWNDFLGPLIYVNKESMYTLALGLQQFIGYYTAQWELLMAAATMIVIPPIVLFAVGQNYFVRGIVMSGLKG